jgi:predicted peptidase
MRAVLAVLMAVAVPAAAKPAPTPVLEGQTAQRPVAPGGLPYLLFIPKGYAASGNERWPLVIFLHGSGEAGSDIELVKKNGPPKLVEKDPAFPFIVISPQLPPAAESVPPWTIAPLDAILDHALKTLRVDPSRVYLTGLSLGGIGTWAWGAAEPERFAALVPVAAFGDPTRACRLKDMPIWAFHGDKDDVVDPRGEIDMVAAVRACGGSPRLTIYPDTGHWSWEAAYSDPQLWLWLLEQRRPHARAR